MLKRFRAIVFTAALLLAWGGQSFGGILPDAFWNWGGPQFLDLLQSRINGKITAGEISGNPLTGLVYQDLVLTGPQGEVLFRSDRLELRLSGESILALHPVISRVALFNPRLYLVQEEEGWNLSRLAPAKPPGSPGTSPSVITEFFLREVNFSSLAVEHGAIVLTRNGVSQPYPDLEIQAAVNLYNWGTPQAKIDLKSAALALTTPQGRAQFSASLSYAPDLVRIHLLDLKLAGRPVVDLKGEICEPFKDLTCKITGRLGPLQGATIHEFWSRWPAPWDLSGRLSFASSTEKMELAATGALGATKFDLKSRFQPGVKPAVFELDLDLQGLAPAQLQEIPGIEARKLQGLSPVNARLQLKGQGLPWNPEQVKADLNLEQFQYKEIKVKRLELALSGNARSQDLHTLLAGNFGTLTLDCRGPLLPVGQAGPGASGDLTLKMAEFQPALLGVAKTAGTVLNGAFTGKFRLPPGYSLTQAHLAGNLAARGRLAGQPLEEFNSRFALEGQKLRLSEAGLRLPGLSATLRGDLSPQGLDVKFSAQVAGSRGLPVPSPAAFTALQTEGTAQGSWQNPLVNLTASGKQFAFQGVKLETASLTARLNGWPPQSGQVQLQGTSLHAGAGAFARVNLSARGDGGRWALQLNAASPKYPQFKLAGTLDLRERPLAALINQVSWQDQHLTVKNQAPFQLRFLPGWEIAPATFQVDGGLVKVQGLVRGEEVSGRLEIQHLEAKLLSPSGFPAQGKINGKLTLAGTPRDPIINGSLALESAKVKGLPLQTLTTNLSYEGERLKVEGYLEEALQQSRLTWKGTVPGRLSLLPPNFALGRQDLYLVLRGEKVDLSLLTAFSQEVQYAQSPLDLLVEMRGDPRQPQISGNIRWGEGCLQSHQAGTLYHLAAGEIRLLGDKVVIPGIILSSEGTLRLAGELELGGPTAARLRAQADNFLVLNRGGNQIWTNGEINLSGPFQALVATGRLELPKAQFRPTFFRSTLDPDIVLVPIKPKPQAGPTPTPYRNLRVDVAIESTGNAFLKDPVGQVEMTGKLRALKQPGQKLALGGEIHALGGTVDVQERAFKVERARLNLPGVPGQPIAVAGRATHQMDEIALVLTVTGALSNPQIRLESEPPLPPSDVLAYLTFGAPTASLSKEQYYALGAQTLGGVLGGITSKKISELLGGGNLPLVGGEMAVKSGTSGGKAILGVEKKITQNAKVSYQRNFNEERGQYERQVIIDYKINKNFSVESQLGTRNPGADLFFNYDF